jgi:hypothetical protein
MSYFIVTNIVWKSNYLGFFKFYQPKAPGGGFLIFEWTLLTAIFHLKFQVSTDWQQQNKRRSHRVVCSIVCTHARATWWSLMGCIKPRRSLGSEPKIPQEHTKINQMRWEWTKRWVYWVLVSDKRATTYLYVSVCLLDKKHVKRVHFDSVLKFFFWFYDFLGSYEWFLRLDVPKWRFS